MTSDDLKPPRTGASLFRVVEVVRDDDGRRVRHGRIWHPDVQTARRFGRALAANSFSDQVLVADAAGTVLETVPEPAQLEPAGWTAWREMALPPLPAKPAGRLAAPRPPASKRRPPASEPPSEPPVLAEVLGEGLADVPLDLPPAAPTVVPAVERTAPITPATLAAAGLR